MTIDYNFDASLGSYVVTFGTVIWDGANGNPAVGCMRYDGEFGMTVTNSTGQAAAASQRLFVNYRIVGRTIAEPESGGVILMFTLEYDDTFQTNYLINYADIAMGDTGWVQFASSTLPFPTGHGNYAKLIITGGVFSSFFDGPEVNPPGTIYIDTIAISDTAPPITAIGGNRLWIYKTVDKGVSWVSRGVKA